ncbi:MAG: phosphate ABC transporter substrate-binding protein, partial [Chloroflexota bacterium]|nr:phosphate ABC transporter substrate-binding protein [Chloroflexota bacterium]
SISGCLLLTACDQAVVATPTPTTITIAGATSMRPVVQALTTEFTRQHPNVLFNLLGGSSTVGEAQVQSGQISLAASTLVPPALSLTATLSSSATVPVRTPIGLDGLALIVHADNPLQNLTLLQLRDLFSGRILDWSELGGMSGEVLLVSREDGSGSRVLFEQRIMGNSPVSLTAVVMPTSSDVVDFVAFNPQAIGYVSRAYVIDALAVQTGESQSAAQSVRIVGVENALPTVEQVSSQQYQLTQPLYLVSRGAPQGWVRELIDFALSPAGQAIVARYHAPLR